MHTQADSRDPYCPCFCSSLNAGCVYFANLCWHLGVDHPHQFTAPAKGVWIIIFYCIIWFSQVSLIRIHHNFLMPSVFTVLIHYFHCLMEEILHHCRTEGEQRFQSGYVVSCYTNERHLRDVGTDTQHSSADLGCPGSCQLGASVRPTPQQELSNCRPTTLWALLSAIPSLPPFSPSVFFPSQGKAFVPGWWEVEAAVAKQIHSGLQQSLLEKKKKAGRRKGVREKNKSIGSSEWIWPKRKKKVPTGNVWKKCKGTSFGLVVAAWLPV